MESCRQHEQHLYNIILVEYSVILDIELADIVRDAVGRLPVAVSGGAGPVAEAEEVDTAALLLLVRGQAEAAGAVLLLPALALALLQYLGQNAGQRNVLMRRINSNLFIGSLTSVS